MRKLIRPEYRRMQEVVRVRLSQQLSKCVFVILLFHLVQSFVFSVTMSPMVSTAGSKPSYLAIGISLLLTGSVVWTSFVFMYGIINFFTKVVLGRRDVMRVFTSGFRDRTRRSFGAAFVFSIIFAISAALALFVILTFKDRIFMLASDYFLDDGTEQQTVNFVRAASLALVFCFVFFVSAIFISIPFLFTWNILLDDKKNFCCLCHCEKPVPHGQKLFPLHWLCDQHLLQECFFHCHTCIHQFKNLLSSIFFKHHIFNDYWILCFYT